MAKEGFSREIRQRVNKEQKHACAICGQKTHLSVHHVTPKSHGGPNTRDNALGVCRTPCHDILDIYAVEKKIYYPEVTMQEGFWHSLTQYPRLSS